MTTQPLVLLLVGFLLTSVLGGLLTYAFQRRAWTHQHNAEGEEHLRELALKTFEEVSTMLDQRLYRMRQLYWATKRQARDRAPSGGLNTALEDYRSVLRVWNDNLNRTLALVDVYFGDAIRGRLEERLYEEFAAIGEELDQFVREASANGSEPVRVRFIGPRLDALGQEVYAFNVLMLTSLRDQRLGDAAQSQRSHWRLSARPCASDTRARGCAGPKWHSKTVPRNSPATATSARRPNAHYASSSEARGSETTASPVRPAGTPWPFVLTQTKTTLSRKRSRHSSHAATRAGLKLTAGQPMGSRCARAHPVGLPGHLGLRMDSSRCEPRIRNSAACRA